MSAVLNLKKPQVIRPVGEIYYPESDGKPMAETDKHIKIISYLRESLSAFFAERKDVYATGCIMFYYIEGAVEECVSPDVTVCFGVPKGERRTYKVWEENDVETAEAKAHAAVARAEAEAARATAVQAENERLRAKLDKLKREK